LIGVRSVTELAKKTTKTGEPFGRPTKYDPKFVQMALDYIGGEGKSVIQFARLIRVGKTTIYEWAKIHDDFRDALSLASDWSQAHWEDKLENMMYSKEVNAPLVKLYFANRFNWTDKQQNVDSEGNTAEPLTVNFEVRTAVDEVTVTNAKPK